MRSYQYQIVPVHDFITASKPQHLFDVGGLAADDPCRLAVPIGANATRHLRPVRPRPAPASPTIAPAGFRVPAIHCLRVATGVEEGTNQVQRAPSSMRCN